MKILGLDDLKLNVYFIIGGIVHDTQNLNLIVNNVCFQTVGKCLKLKIYDYRVIALHGDIVINDPVGFIITGILNKPVFVHLFRTLMV